MAILKKTLFDEKLETINVLVNDTDPNSRYFKITELEDTFTGGKNAFLIQGCPELVADTIVKIQIKDSKGNTIYYEPGEGIPEYYEGTSKVVAVYIYPDTAFGPCTITILGELKEYETNGVMVPVPENWKDKYNVKWEREVNVNPSLPNTTKIRFYRRPKVSVQESILNIYNRDVIRTTISGSANGISILPTSGSDYRTYKGELQYQLQLNNSNNFSQSMVGETVTISGASIYGGVSNYVTTIKEVLTNNTALLSTPYYESSSLSPNYYSITDFVSQSYTLSFDDTVTLTSSNVSSSFAKIKITDLETFTGDANRVKVYASSRNSLGDFQLLEDIQLESNELLLEDEYNGDLNVRTGIFSQNVLNDFWLSQSLDTTVTASIDNEQLLSSVKLKPTTDSTSSIGLFKFYNSASIDFSQNTEYQLDFTPLLSSSLGLGKIEIYGSGSAFVNTDNILQYGKLLGELETTNTFQKYDKQQINFKADSNGVGNIVFLVKGGVWQLSNISLRAAQESSFSPNEVTLVANVPTRINNETFDFKVELYDVNNNYVPVLIEKVFTFTGGNDTVTGTITTISSSIGFDITQVSQSISGTITFNSSSISGTVGSLSSSVSGSIGTVSGSVFTLSGSVSGTIGTLSGSVSGTIGTLSSSVSGSIGVVSGSVFTLSGSVSSSLTVVSASISTSFSSSTAYALSQSNYTFNRATSELQKLADGNYSGSFIGATTIFSPAIGGINGYISNVFRVGQGGITLDGTNKAIYVGTGSYNNSSTPFYFASGSTNIFSLGNKLSWNGSQLNVSGTISGSAIVGSTVFGTAIEGGSISIGSGFTVNQFGELFATNATVSGSVTAGEGNIGGFEVDTNKLIGSGSLLVLDAALPEIQIYTGSSGSPKVVLNSNPSLTSTGGTTVYVSGSSYAGTSGTFNVITNYDGLVYNSKTTTFSQSFGTTVNISLSNTNLEFGTQPFAVFLPEVQVGVNNLQQTYTSITASAPSPPYLPSFENEVYNPYYVTPQNSLLTWYLQLYDSSGTTLQSETEIPNSTIRLVGAYRQSYYQAINDPDPEITFSWQLVTVNSPETYTGNLGTAGTRPFRTGFISVPSTAQYKVRMVAKVTSNIGSVSGQVGGVFVFDSYPNTASFVQADSANINYLDFRFSPNINKTEINGGGIQVLTNANVYVRTYRLDNASSNQKIFEVKGGYGEFEGYSQYTSSAIVANGEILAKSTVRIGSEYGSFFGPASHAPGPLIVTSKWTHPSASAYFETNVEPGDGVFTVISPPYTVVNDGVWNLGSSTWRWKDIWATNGTIQTSDANLKTEISASNLGLDFINKLNPVSYKKKNAKTSRVEVTLDDGTTKEKNVANGVGNRRHYGLIAQEVKQAIEDSGLTTMDFAGYIAGNVEEDTNLALRYDEFISPMIKAIQELSEKVNKLEEIISGST